MFLLTQSRQDLPNEVLEYFTRKSRDEESSFEVYAIKKRYQPMHANTSENLLSLDREYLWHPYTSMPNALPPYLVESASRVRLRLADGRELIDGMSSWWAAIHGYRHPVLDEAASKQLPAMSHVMFGGLTHQPAVELAALLVSITPEPLQAVFFSDSGSVAVEVAIKMALQYWHSLGHPEKQRLLTIRSGYHGDTFGAMAVCDPVTGMHEIFRDILPQHFFAEAPRCKYNDSWEEQYIEDFHELLHAHHDEIAAAIFEPVVQGAGGMRFYSPHYVRRARELCDEYNVLLILDEIATGFGRTGTLFACEQAGIAPDIMCLGKALTGGYLTLACTLSNRRVSDGISAHGTRAFMHGPTFMANPLACSVALASLKLLLSTPWQKRINEIEARLKEGLSPCSRMDHVKDVRVLGAIGVVELNHPVDLAVIQERFVARGVWIRPFGRLVYTMPPYIIEDPDLEKLTTGIVEVIEEENYSPAAFR